MSYNSTFFNKVSQGLLVIASLPVVIATVSPLAVSAQSTQNITQIVVAGSTTSTLEKLVIAAGLDGTLAGTGPFTLFAPNDAAFAKLDATTLNTLQAPENKTLLADILKYHVVSGNVSSTVARTLTTATSVQGDSIGISVISNNLTLNASSRVITADVAASNGVIHIIDTVIISPSLSTRLATANNLTTVRSGGANQSSNIWLVSGLIVLAGATASAFYFSPIAKKIRR